MDTGVVQPRQIRAFVIGTAIGAAATYLLMRGSRTTEGASPPEVDRLTGVADRQAGERRIDRLRRGDAVVMVDIDGFKSVNDSVGHASGDTVLTAFAAALAASVRTGDLVARWGGDEFVVVLAGADDSALAITRRLHEAWAVTKQEPRVTCSAGVAVHPGGDPQATLAAADAAMYAAKRAGRDRVEAALPPR